jgi:hypothetical protein
MASGTGPGPINARDYIVSGTTIRLCCAVAVFVFFPLLTILVTWGLALIFWGIGFLIYWLRLSKARAALRGSALRLGPNQFPDIHQKLAEMSARLGLKETP